MEVIENTEKAILDYAEKGYGQGIEDITDENIEILKSGKLLAFSDGEYTHLLRYKK